MHIMATSVELALENERHAIRRADQFMDLSY